MKTKALAVLTAVTMCTCLAACGKKEGNDANAETSESAASAAVTTSQTSAAEVSSGDPVTDKAADDDTEKRDTAGNRASSAGNSKLEAAKDSAADKTEVPSGGAGGADSSESGGSDNKTDELIITDSMIKSGGITFRKSKSGIMTMNEDELDSEPTDEDLSGTLEAILAQYRAAENKDLDAFIKTFRFTDLVDITADMLKDMSVYQDDDSFLEHLVETGQGTKYEIIDDITSFICDLIEEKHQDKFFDLLDNPDADHTEETKEFLRQAYADIKASSQTVKDNIEYETIFDSENGVAPLEGVSEDSVYIFYIEHCSHENTASGQALYMNCELMILTKETQYSFADIIVYKTKDGYGVFLGDELQSEAIDKEAKGKDPDELFEMLKEEARKSNTEKNDK